MILLWYQSRLSYDVKPASGLLSRCLFSVENSSVNKSLSLDFYKNFSA